MISSYLGNAILPPLNLHSAAWQSPPPATGPISILRWSDFKAFERSGSRQYDTPFQERYRRLDHTASALLLGDDSQLDNLHDLIWAICEQTQWWLSAHVFVAPIDLCVAMTAEVFGLLDAAFGSRLDPEVRNRMTREVQTRVLTPYLEQNFFWSDTESNWNAVCHAGVGVGALAFEKDPVRLDAIFDKILHGLPHFRDGFTDDGGCSEGPGYWRYGMYHFATLAFALHHFTRGEINLASDPKWTHVASYPVAVTTAPGRDLTFSDTTDAHAPFALSTASMLHTLTGVTDLFALCEQRDGKPVARTLLDLLTLPETIPAFNPAPFRSDALLPDLAIAKLHGHSGLVLGVKAGHNAEHHNHNDVGAFLLFHDGAQWFADPGAPVYSARTFNQHRYESLFTSSRGHCVPVINGLYQSPGDNFRGTLTTPATPDAKHAVVNFPAAYAVPELTTLTRELTLSTVAPEFTLRDHFTFDGSGLPVRDAFLTALPVEQRTASEVLLLHPNGHRALFRALTPGAFSVEELREESKESRTGQLLRRILFTPEKILPAQTLAFHFALLS